MTKGTYRIFDIAIFSVISIILEIANLFSFKYFPLEGFSASFVIVLGLIAIYRWNLWGLIVPVSTGIVTVLVSKQYQIGYMLAYTVGYLSMGLAAIWFKYKDKSTIKNDPLFMFGYFLTGFFAAQIGRAICYSFDGNFLSALYSCFVLDLLNLVLNGAVFVIAVHQKKLVYDMNQYLVEVAEIQKQPSSARMRENQEDYLSLESLAESNQVSDSALLDGGMLTEDDLKELQKNYNELTGTESKYGKKK